MEKGILKLTSKQLSYLSKAINAERFGREEVNNTSRNTLTAQEHDELNENINRLVCVVKDQPLERIPEETEELERFNTETYAGEEFSLVFTYDGKPFTIEWLRSYIQNEIEKAREEGYQKGWKDGSKGRVFNKVEIKEEVHIPKELLDKVRQEGTFTKRELEILSYWADSIRGEYNSLRDDEYEALDDKIDLLLSKLTKK